MLSVGWFNSLGVGMDGRYGVFGPSGKTLTSPSLGGHDEAMVTLPAQSSAASPTVMPVDQHGQGIDPENADRELEPLDAPARLRWALDSFAERLALTTSFGIQSSVLLHMVSELRGSGPESSVPVIWVDTGYLPPETYRYAEQLCALLSINLHVVQAEISPARMEALHGRLWETGEAKDLEFYNRIRKVEPLDQAFKDLGVSCWASGVRGGQTDHRRRMRPLESVRGLWSLRPLLSWSRRDVFYYMERHGLPQHPLFEQGYSTVGDWHTSAPDTGDVSGRATRFGGRSQECGIHLPGLMGEGI